MAIPRAIFGSPAVLAVLLGLTLMGLLLSLSPPRPAAAFPVPAQKGHWQLQLTSLWANREDETDDEPYIVVIGFVSRLGEAGSTRVIYERPFQELDERSYSGGDAERAAIPSWMGVIDFGEIETDENDTIVGAVVVAMEHDGTPWRYVRDVFDGLAEEVRIRLRDLIEPGTLTGGGGSGGGGGGSIAIVAEVGNRLKEVFDSGDIRLVSLGRDGDDVVGVQILAWTDLLEPQSPLGCGDRPWEIGTFPELIMPLRETTFDRPPVSANACNSLRFSGKSLPGSPSPAIGDSPAFYEVSGRMTSITPRAGALVEPANNSNHWGSLDLSVRLCGGCHTVTAVRYVATYDKGDGAGIRDYVVAWGDPNRGWAATWNLAGVPRQTASVRAEMSTSVGWALSTHTGIGLNIDATPPTGRISAPLAGAVDGGSVRVAAQVSDGQSGVDRVDFWYETAAGRHAIGAGTAANGYAVNWSSGTLNGQVRIGGTVYDRQNNSVPLEPVSVTIDNSPPTVASVFPSPSQRVWVTSPTVKLRATASDPGGAVREVRFTGFYRDPAGRLVEKFVGADTAPDSAGFYSVAWDLSGVPEQADRTSPYDLLVVVAAVDRAGNVSPLTGSSGGSFIGFDRTPPSVRVVSPATWVATSQASFPIEVTASDALGVSGRVARLTITARYREAGATQATDHTLASLTNVTGWSGNLSLAGLSEQSVTITAVARDEAGLVSNHGGSIAIDRTPPSVSGVTVSPNPFVTNGTRTLSIGYQLSEPANAVSMGIYNSAGSRVRELAFSNVNTDPKIALWDGRDNAGNLVASGSYSFRIEARDAAGNLGSYQGGAFTVTVDTTAPAVSVVLSPNPYSLAAGLLNIRYQQNEAARTEIEILNASGQVVRYLGAWQESAGIYNRTWDGTAANGLRVAAPATYTVRLRVTDLAGNTTTVTRSLQVQP